jgi:hypothetical protein
MILETAVRNALADAFDVEVNAGAAATFVFETSADGEVATITLQDPAFGAAATGVLTLQGVTLSDTSATGGTVAQCSIFEDATKICEFTCGTGAEEISISSVTVAATDQVDLTALTVTMPAS